MNTTTTARHATEDETCDEWFDRYHARQRALGQYGTRSQWRTWISPCIGTKRWTEVTTDDIEDLRDGLDGAILRWRASGRGNGRICGRTAMSIWWALTGAIREAIASKQRDLRALAGRLNPSAGVLAPGDKDSRQHRRKTFVYPSEFARLMDCRRVPLPWREAHAIAAYSYLRPGELRALRWDDVDIEHQRILVNKAWSHLDGCIKAPKTRSGIRDVPIHPELLPVLRRMRRTRVATSDLVVPVLAAVPRDTLAARTRRHLVIANVSRAALHNSSLTMVRANFRSWRDSGITWLAIAGVDAAKIMRRAGHDDMGTTMRYVKQAEDVDGELGEPFARLPRELRHG